MTDADRPSLSTPADSRSAGPRLRIMLGNATAIGPGKARLLGLIEEHGSISGAAREMKMSYRRAWTLVESLNAAFRLPLVEAAVGGKGGGGARVTDAGREALQRYRAMERKAAKSVAAELEGFGELLNPEFEEPPQ